MLTYLRLPKTGSTWVIESIKSLNLPVNLIPSHMGYLDAKELFPDSDFFTTIRHPCNWYRSFWRFRMDTGWGGNWTIGHPPYDIANFEEFIEKVTSEVPGYLTDLYNNFVFPGVTILKQENLAFELAYFLKEPKLLRIPKVNQSRTPCSMSKQAWDLIVKSEQEIIDKHYSRSNIKWTG